MRIGLGVRGLLVVAALTSSVNSAGAVVVSIGAAADNTLFEDSGGNLSNGAGQHFFAGRTNFDVLRRGLIRFDIAAGIPAGSVITDVSLRLNMSRGTSSLAPVSLHRALAAWGEGASDALDEEGTGIGAEAGDATWLHTFWPGGLWTTPGGDFAIDPSATSLVSVAGPYQWSSAGLVADAQAWLDAPGTNAGWFVLGDETQFPTAKRFDTRENPLAENRPILTITYTVPAPWTLGVILAGLSVRRRPR